MYLHILSIFVISYKPSPVTRYNVLTHSFSIFVLSYKPFLMTRYNVLTHSLSIFVISYKPSPVTRYNVLTHFLSIFVICYKPSPMTRYNVLTHSLSIFVISSSRSSCSWSLNFAIRLKKKIQFNPCCVSHQTPHYLQYIPFVWAPTPSLSWRHSIVYHVYYV